MVTPSFSTNEPLSKKLHMDQQLTILTENFWAISKRPMLKGHILIKQIFQFSQITNKHPNFDRIEKFKTKVIRCVIYLSIKKRLNGKERQKSLFRINAKKNLEQLLINGSLNSFNSNIYNKSHLQFSKKKNIYVYYSFIKSNE